MVERAASRVHATIVDSSRRWERFVHRPGDVFVCTPPKVGTTLTQGIVRSLIWGPQEPPGVISETCPWLDARFEPIDEVLARLDAQDHRRCIKSHSPADAIPLFEDAFYIAVYRGGLDSFMSWVNHLRHMHADQIAAWAAEAVAEGVELGPAPDLDDLHKIFDRWLLDPPQIAHFATWWPLRTEPNVQILHYNDLLTDLEGEMRRLGHWLGIEVEESAWPRVVERCSIDEMRSAERSNPWVQRHFKGGADTFFHKGTNGRWRGVLSDEEVAGYETMVDERLSDTERAWFENGSIALGRRPEAL